VYEDGDGTEVAIADPEIIVQTLNKPDLAEIARDAREKLQRVAASLRDEGG